ncbi:acyl-CoA dehydratase activase [Fuchsiella alkaliacetigena]|uniref:acyl-CoA dehydratase activase n=1 Tax=Fuchsiella alkaliacetigena TaxID=957042 RepID=UPI00200AC5D1|nr:acyl-CoA dehydratase activase [Fuchsiella alkaliacetigena]MCK8825175.1 acyl-CoA dehydratase activase [Fuchsiella alkaliacetigena]
MKAYLGIDVGSVSTNLVLTNQNQEVLEKLYLRTQGRPIDIIQSGLEQLKPKVGDLQIKGVGTTGSARNLAGVMVGADVVKNEITAHAVAASQMVSGVRTVLEIGGQDSKIIILREGVVTDFAMNTVCAAGTGSFLDQQASRLGIPIEDFGDLALEAEEGVRVAGRCSVFAESDMIHKQQLGHCTEDIIAGLCEALVRNYLNNVGQGKEILEPIIFQGGVAANAGIKKAFAEELSADIHVPEHYNVMGALGAAILAQEQVKNKQQSSFKGFAVTEFDYDVSSFECNSCPNYCEIINIYQQEELIARWGSKCTRWEAI